MPAIRSWLKSKKRKIWSKAWKSSKNPTKQRKYQRNAPLHIKRKLLSAHLSKELRQKYNVRSLPIRKGDVVIVMRGYFKGRKSEVEKINVKETRVYLKGITRKKADGSEISIPFHPSNLMIVELNLSDKYRLNTDKGKNEVSKEKR